MNVRILKDCLILGSTVLHAGDIATREHASAERLKSLVEEGHARHALDLGPIGDDQAGADDGADDEADDEAPPPSPLPALRGRKSNPKS